MKKDHVTNVRVNREQKDTVDEILKELGLNFSEVVNILIHQIILIRGVPFPIIKPPEEQVDVEGGFMATDEPELTASLKDSLVNENLPNEYADEVEEVEPVIEPEQGDNSSVEGNADSSSISDSLITESPSEIDLEDILNGVPDLETPNNSNRDEESASNNGIMSALEGSEDFPGGISELENIFDAFKSMNI